MPPPRKSPATGWRLLKLEMKAKDKNQAVKLGSYEQNIGLKRGLPRR